MSDREVGGGGRFYMHKQSERERETETERQTDRQTDRQTEGGRGSK